MKKLTAMYTPRQKILWFSVTSRVTVILLQFIFNSLCPDHDADAFRSPRSSSEEISVYDKVVDSLLSGLTRWDSQHFIHIAKYGYTYENSLAFFPLYPISVRCLATVLQKILFMLNQHSVITISAVLINFVCFIKSAVVFYDLSKRVLGCTNTAYKAAILYCVNPASIFFSAGYSESMFAYLTFYCMLASWENRKYVYLPIGLSALVRSNGLVNIGLPMYVCLQKWVFLVFPKIIYEYKNHSLKKAVGFGLTRAFTSTIDILNTIFLSLVPFIFFHIYIYISFCTEHSRTNIIPEHVVLFAVENQLPMPGNDTIAWCQESLPLFYSRIQEKYWNVGLMKYYRLKQIPNFILAFPILYIMFRCVYEYFAEHKHALNRHKERTNKRSLETRRQIRFPRQMFVFVVHGFFLWLSCILFVHIQVSTRLLASASPIIYWYCASVMSYKQNISDKSDNDYEEKNNAFSRWKVFFLEQKEYTATDRFVLAYFLGYFILGCILHPNFLPWT